VVAGAIDKVLSVLASNPNISQRAIQALTGLSNRAVRYALEELKDLGRVEELISFSDLRIRRYALK